jgi:peptidoglycan/LPS O-acetylase OafA/YrhL
VLTRRRGHPTLEPASLAGLAHNPDVLRGADPPRFPASLIDHEQRYVEALAGSDEADVSAQRATLQSAIETLLDKDRERVETLDHRPDRLGERRFLHARRLVLEARLRSLRDDRAHVEQEVRAEDPRSPLQLGASSAPGRLSSALGLNGAPRVPEQAHSARHEAAAPESGSKHRNDIQGLRAVAVLLVALGHAGVGFLAGGFIGVDVFFVLSGFLITGLLLNEAREHRRVSLLEFYIRRGRRIIPAAILTLVATDLVAYHLLNIVRAKQYLQDSVSSALFAANFHFAAIGTNYFAQGQPPSPLQHFWSLSIEEQFYFVWPALFAIALGLLLRRRDRLVPVGEVAVRRVLIVVATIAAGSLVWSIHSTLQQPAGAYFSTFARVWELALGAALAISATWLTRVPGAWLTAMGWGGLLLIAAAAVTFSAATPFPGYAALLPTVGAALVIAAGIATTSRPRSAARVLSLRPLRYIGDRSYAFYLWHWPVLVIAAQYAGHDLSLGTNLLLLAGAFALSVVSYRLVEKPLRFAKMTRRPESLLVWAASILVVVALATTYVSSITDREVRQRLQSERTPLPVLSLPAASLTSGLSSSSLSVAQQLPAVAAAVTSASHARGVPAVLHPPITQLLGDIAQLPASCTAHNGETSARICRLAASASSRTLVVLGDSHAEMWMPAILSLGRHDKLAVVPLIKSGCSPVMWTGSIGPSECRSWFRWAMAKATALAPRATLIAGFYSYVGPGHDQALLSGLGAAVGDLKKASTRVVLLGDVPERARQPVDCLLASNASLAGCSDALTTGQVQLDGVVARFAQYDQIGFIDSTGWFCYQSTCPLVVSNIITYRDFNHVSQTYATALGGAFRAAFDSVTAHG